ncbi:hypothetical protein BDV33DRAFT_167567, partial [Aspergillus novoparasiticus]
SSVTCPCEILKITSKSSRCSSGIVPERIFSIFALHSLSICVLSCSSKILAILNELQCGSLNPQQCSGSEKGVS